MALNGQLGKYVRSRRAGSAKATTKKFTARKARRDGKRLLEDAPPRATKGWAD